MESLLYIALCDLNDKANGVSQKVISQINALRNNGYNTKSIAYFSDDSCLYSENESIILRKKSKLETKRANLFRTTMKYIKNNDFQICYIRFPHCDWLFLKLLNQLKRRGIRVYLEFPTYPLSYPRRNIKSFIFKKLDNTYLKKIKKYIYKTISIGPVIDEIYGIENTSIPNGINKKIFSNNYSSNTELNILSISSMFIEHGIDRLIKSLNQYILNDNRTKVTIHLVGDGPELDNLKQMVSEYKLENNVKFYGFLYGNEIEKVYEICNMGCGPLSTYLVGLNVASPLKTKDYLAHGLPFICSYDEMLIDDDFKYILKIPNDNSLIDFNNLVDFFKSYSANFHNTQKEIKEYAEENFSWENIMKCIK